MSKWKTIKKDTSFTSLRLNCWNIAQVIQKCKMLTNFSRILTCYLTQSYLLKKKNLLSLRHWCFPGKFRNFLEEQKQPLQVLCKNDVLKNFAIFAELRLCWKLFKIKLLQAAAFSTAALLKRDSNTCVFLWILRNF